MSAIPRKIFTRPTLRQRARVEWEGCKYVGRDLLRALPYAVATAAVFVLLFLAMSL